MDYTAMRDFDSALTRSRLTWLYHRDGLWLGQLQRSDPLLSLHLRAGFEVERERSAAGDDEAAWVLRVDERVGEVDCATTRVTHFRRVSVTSQVHVLNVQAPPTACDTDIVTAPPGLKLALH